MIIGIVAIRITVEALAIKEPLVLDEVDRGSRTRVPGSQQASRLFSGTEADPKRLADLDQLPGGLASLAVERKQRQGPYPRRGLVASQVSDRFRETTTPGIGIVLGRDVNDRDGFAARGVQGGMRMARPFRGAPLGGGTRPICPGGRR